MKRKNLYALSAICGMGLMLASCSTASAPKASLKNNVDSLSYAYGVNMAGEGGLMQFLEQSGVIQNVSNIKYEYEMRIVAADSTQREALQKELESKMDSLNKVNGPKLDLFLKGLKEAFNSSKDNSVYVQGLTIGTQISEQMMPQLEQMIFAGDSTKKLNKDQVLAGMIGVLKNQKTAMETADASTYFNTQMEKAQQNEMDRREEQLKTQYADTIAANKAWLDENAKAEGVTVLPSGLQYKVLRAGKGAMPTATSKVKVNYHGTLVDGTVFDSSINRGEPAEFVANQVIPGWTEALQLMPVGSKWRLFIPADLAYGSQDRGTIRPFSTLIFDVELLDIVE